MRRKDNHQRKEQQYAKVMTRKRSDLKVWRLDYLALLEEQEIPNPERRSPRWKEWYEEYLHFLGEQVPPAEREHFSEQLIDALNDRYWCKYHGINYQDPHIHLAALKLCKELWSERHVPQETGKNVKVMGDSLSVYTQETEGKTIFVIDDEAPICDLMQEILTTLGYQTITCHSGAEALAKIQEQKPDMIFLDLFMPGEDGLTLLPKLFTFIPDLPVVILTGMPSLETARVAVKLGVRDYLSKPFDMALIQQIVEDVFQN
jgi:CheY-like chemotaxis protein